MWTGSQKCWRVRLRSFTHVSYKLMAGSVNAGTLRMRASVGTRGSIIAGLKSVDYRRLGRRESGLTLGSLLVAFVITFTVAGSVALGITLAYTAVLGLLHAFAPSSRKPQPALVL